MERSATISSCGKYRYSLGRQWSQEPPAVFIMLNPSTADADNDDPTIRRCIGFAKSWGCGGIKVLNLFAVRTPSPAVMKKETDPVGRENRSFFERTFHNEVGPVVCAWGSHGDFMGQDLEVMGWLDEMTDNPQCLGLTKDMHPKHPLYLAATSPLIPYRGRRWKAQNGYSVLITAQPTGDTHGK